MAPGRLSDSKTPCHLGDRFALVDHLVFLYNVERTFRRVSCSSWGFLSDVFWSVFISGGSDSVQHFSCVQAVVPLYALANMTHVLAVIGGGKMGSAIVRGLVDGRVLSTEDVIVVEQNVQRRRFLETLFEGTVPVVSTVPRADYYLLATKPQDIARAVREIVNVNEQGILVSIAAGVTLKTLHELSSYKATCIRVMPNAPAMIGQGLSAICSNDSVPQSVKDFVSELFGAVGDVIFIDESKMNLMTAVSGSGPAYLYLFAEAFEDAAVALGLPYDLAKKIVQKTILGASLMYARDEEDLRTLRRDVTSPGGTTAAGTMELERFALRRALFDAVEAAMVKAESLGNA